MGAGARYSTHTRYQEIHGSVILVSLICISKLRICVDYEHKERLLLERNALESLRRNLFPSSACNFQEIKAEIHTISSSVQHSELMSDTVIFIGIDRDRFGSLSSHDDKGDELSSRRGGRLTAA